jgi:hypothetical protein
VNNAFIVLQKERLFEMCFIYCRVGSVVVAVDGDEGVDEFVVADNDSISQHLPVSS